jgi:hypothetical protein
VNARRLVLMIGIVGGRRGGGGLRGKLGKRGERDCGGGSAWLLFGWPSPAWEEQVPGTLHSRQNGLFVRFRLLRSAAAEKKKGEGRVLEMIDKMRSSWQMRCVVHER